MATKKDLVEAYSFSRRRLVTAFVSGAPGGREVEPNRPGRAIVGGLALAVLLVAGGAVLGILKSPGTADLDKAGSLVSEKETGADYLVLDRRDGDGTELRPLANITSAMLLFGSEIKSEKVPRSELNDQQIGDPIGILDAPATPPQRADLVQDGWAACTGVVGAGRAVGIKVDVSETPETTLTPDQAFVVSTESGGLYLIAQSAAGVSRSNAQRAYAYPVPYETSADKDASKRILDAVAGTAPPSAVRVPDAWVSLFPPGGTLSLTTFGLTPQALDEPWGPRASLTDRDRDKAQVGDLLTIGAEVYVLTRQGVLRLDPFSDALYRSLGSPQGNPLRTFTAPQVPEGASISFAAGLDDAFWPDVPRRAEPRGQLCAQLDVPGGQPGVLLATTEPDSDASAVDVAPQAVERSVDSGAGAFVRSGSWTGEGLTTPFLVDARGYSYSVGPQDEVANLGYDGVDEVVVPRPWIDLFQDGVPLTIDAARCPPTSDPDGSCS